MFDLRNLRATTATGLWESWSRGRVLALAFLLVLGNFAFQLAWYDRVGGLFAPVAAGAIGGVFLPLLVLGWRWRWRRAQDFGLDRPTPVAAAGAVLMALAALAPGSLLAYLSLKLHPVDAQWLANYTQNLPVSATEIAVAAFAVVICGPLAEEIIFRGLIHRVFSRTWGPWPAIAASSIVFGLVHGEPWYLLGLIGVGLMLAFIWEATGSLTACWLAHAVHNGISLGLMVAEGPAGAEPTTPTPVDLALAAGSLVMLVLVGRWLRRAAAH
ncbi:MAG: CPBP family intramembrane metalloprotease [bacterium]|nr:CPBP family intramembrane metalloprotease [bacterium]